MFDPGCWNLTCTSMGPPHCNHGPSNKCVITHRYRRIQKKKKKKKEKKRKKKRKKKEISSAVKSKQAGYCFGNFDKGCDSVLVLGRLGAAREEPLT
jgi:hypothetical protein